MNKYNTEVDWSEDTDTDRHATIKFFYRRLIFTLTHDSYIRIDRTDCRSIPIVSNERGFRVRY